MNRAQLIIVTAFALVTSTALSAQQAVWGLGRAKDGDSLMVGESEVRLYGIDAPEFDQACNRNGQSWACGAGAADQLMQLVTGKDVECTSMGKDEHQRVLGRCSVNGMEINRAMVAMGYAVAYRRYSSDYVATEDSAKAAKLGLWAGTFEQPEKFRHTGGVTAAAPHRASRSGARSSSSDWAGRAQANCSIKGNRNRRGEWIYHLPGMPYYDQTRPEEIFCSEAEARAAGYRRAMVR